MEPSNRKRLMVSTRRSYCIPYQGDPICRDVNTCKSHNLIGMPLSDVRYENARYCWKVISLLEKKLDGE